MSTIRIKATIQTDGELFISNLPCKRGDEVEAIVILPTAVAEGQHRDEARRRFLERARSSSFRSREPYPRRDELHERH